VKGEIEVAHGEAAIGIPSASRADVEQTLAGFRQYFSAVDEAKSEFLSFSDWLGKNHGDHIIAATSQPGAFDGRILDEFHGVPVRFDSLKLQKARQFEYQKT
jgi:hypothetical protein